MNNPSKQFELIRLYPNLSSDPVNGRKGEIYYNTALNRPRYCIQDTPSVVWADFGLAAIGTQTIANNQVAPADVTGLLLDSAQEKGARLDYTIHREHSAPAGGTVDTAFNANIPTDLNGPAFYTVPNGTGTVIAVGAFTVYSGARNYVVGLNDDGTINTSFTTNLGTGFNSDAVSAVALANGKCIIVGNFTSFNGNTRNRIVCLNTDGTEDTSFYTNVGTGFVGGYVYSIALQTDGKLLVGGGFSSFNGNARPGFVRLNTNGTEDSAFAANIGTSIGGLITEITSSPDNTKIAFSGIFNSYKGNTRNNLVVLNTDGTEDTTFATNLGTGFNAYVYACQFTSSNKVLAAGGFGTINGVSRPNFGRVNADGTLDTSFNTTIPSYGNEGTAIKLDSSGLIYVCVGVGPFIKTYNDAGVAGFTVNTDGIVLRSGFYYDAANNKMYASGVFNKMASLSAYRIGRFSTTGNASLATKVGSCNMYYDGSAWNIANETSAGDDPSVPLSVTAGGQVQYTSSNYAGTVVSSYLKYILTKL